MSHTARTFFAQLARATRWRLVGAVALMVAFSLTEGFGILLLLPTLQAAGMNLAGQDSAGRYARIIERAFSAVGVTPSLEILLAMLVALIALRTIVGRLQSMAMFAVEHQFVLEMRLRLYRAIANANWLFICRSRASDFIHALTGELDRVGQAAYDIMLVSANVVLTAVYCAIALRLSAAMTLLVLSCGAVLAIVLRGRTRAIEQAGQKQSDFKASLYAVTIEHLHSLKTAKASGAEERNFSIFARSSRALVATDLAAIGTQAAATAWFELGSAAIMGAVLYAAIRVLAVPPAAILILLVLFARVMPRLMSGHQHWRAIGGLLPSFANLIALEQRCAAAAEPGVPNAPPPDLRREIRFDRVSFSYGRDRAPAVFRADLVIPAGAVVALVGPSGAGKSTVADLAMGLIAPDEGVIWIDGAELTPVQARQWRRCVGYVAPDTFLFHDTLRANLEWARAGASETDIREALSIAAADDFLAALPMGLDTVIGDRGVALSQGERQRIALARAILRRPRLLVLDEATNYLDSASEARVLGALEKLGAGTTTILIAHRIATVKWADLIYVIEDGRVVESGDWNALSARPAGRFRAMREAQELAA
ncbi:MAG TPA: ABC transporter ATP-binding protein [Gemmatimonadaceae bacterium]